MRGVVMPGNPLTLRALAVLAVFALAVSLLVLAARPASTQEPPLPDLRAEGISGPSSVKRGEVAAYKYFVANAGPEDVTLPRGGVLVRGTIGRARLNGAGAGGGAGDGFGISSTQLRRKAVLELIAVESSSTFPSGASGELDHRVDLRARPHANRIIACFTMDPDNNVPESDESNNTACLVTDIVR